MNSDAVHIAPLMEVWTKTPPEGGIYENVEVRRLGDRHFVVGTLADEGTADADPRTGYTFWFPIEDIILLTEFPSLEAVRKYYAGLGGKRKAKKKPKKR
jgi:hypothetical protein